MGAPFGLKYGTHFALSDEVVYALLTDDDRVREQIAGLTGSLVRIEGTKLPEVTDDEVTKINVTDVTLDFVRNPRGPSEPP